MIIILLKLLLFASLASASPFHVCPYNLLERYYVVYGPNPLKSAQAPEQFSGMRSYLYPIACESYGLRPANITSDLVPAVLSLRNQCMATPLGKQFPFDAPAMWVHSYEGLPLLSTCNALFSDGSVGGGFRICYNYTMPALCQVPIDAIAITSTTFTEAETITEGVTSLITSVFISTETITDYVVTRTTTIITQDTSTVTTLTTTRTRTSRRPCRTTVTLTTIKTYTKPTRSSSSCRTVTKTTTRIVKPTCSDSSSSDDCFSHHHHHHHHRNHHRHRGKNQESVSDSKGTNINKAAAVPDRVEQNYIQCTTSVSGFYLVQLTTPPNSQERQAQPDSQGSGEKGVQRKDIMAVAACAYLGYSLANITDPILDSLGPLFDVCLGPEAETSVVYNSYYGYTPLCGYLRFGVDSGIILNDNDTYSCFYADWALCYAGPPIVTTSTILTGPFSTATVEFTQTESLIITESGSISETITENDILTVTSTSFLPVTLTTSTTVPTTTITLTSTSITSYCSCHKPGCRHRHH